MGGTSTEEVIGTGGVGEGSFGESASKLGGFGVEEETTTFDEVLEGELGMRTFLSLSKT